MKIIIAGTRTITDWTLVNFTINNCPFISRITEEVSGCEPDGVDRLGERWANLHKVPIKRFPAQWKAYGKSAGPKRNKQMAQYISEPNAEGIIDGGLIAIWDGKSFGTKSMIEYAKTYIDPEFIYVRIVASSSISM